MSPRLGRPILKSLGDGCVVYGVSYIGFTAGEVADCGLLGGFGGIECNGARVVGEGTLERGGRECLLPSIRCKG
jgi:hypothetical protein